MDNSTKTTALRRRLNGEEINALPLCHYGGKVRIIRSLADLSTARPDLTSEPVLGFDTETRPTFHKGKINAPSLIQLATGQAVYLIQLNFLAFSQPLAEILANPGQVKAGVAINDDMKQLAVLYDFEPAGLVDIGALARSHKLPAQGLRTLAANLFARRISKGPRCSNWSLVELSNRQIAYAATDAWMSRLIFLRMRELGLAPDAARKEGCGALDILAAQEVRGTPDL
ncbi:MAG: 3'-5' exonuclease domain-containing protein 2 [Desulfovibrio sp.]|jgi:ribonuclease D|nr:3'-5' exonuclease domain-containing protein 2 [Desulfovibrio sp.]